MKLCVFVLVLMVCVVEGQPPIPKKFDWREKGVVPPVKNQGQMGDPFIIDAVTAAESFFAIKTGKLLSLSLFEAIDCCEKGSGPGRLMNTIFDCFAHIGGLCTTQTYPKSYGKCANNTCSGVKGMEGGRRVTPGNETALLYSVLKTPVLVAIDASHTSFQVYESGIYEDPDCKSESLDHSLLVVGYGSEEGEDYWICQNSWGECGCVCMVRSMFQCITLDSLLHAHLHLYTPMHARMHPCRS